MNGHPGKWFGSAGETRVPYDLFGSQSVYELEQKRVFQGPTWNYLCLEAELAAAGDFRTTYVGDMPIVVTRDEDGEIYAFENRCAHRGALICLEDAGNSPDFKCVYHAWSYDCQGNLKGVAFEHGIGGKGGMPESFRKEDHGPRKLRVATLNGLVFGSLSDEVLPLDEYLGTEIVGKIQRVLRKPVEVLGRYTQALPNNWKLYAENTRDTYHASLLHLFFTTFNLGHLGHGGGVVISPSGGHHASATIKSPDAQGGDPNSNYSDQRAYSEGYRLHDHSMLELREEFGDLIVGQILSVFPGFVLQQIQNCLAVRQIVPRGPDGMDLNWTYIGFADDAPELRELRLRQLNLVGPAGYVSMEDGAVGNFVQRGIAAARDDCSVLEFGGTESRSQTHRVTEAAVRGFWRHYRHVMEG